MTNSITSPRQAALLCLKKWDTSHAFAETLIDQQAVQAQLKTSDRNLMQAIVFGVLRNRSWLDYLISKLRKGRLDSPTRLILEMGLCQIFIMQLARHAAVFETVSITPTKARGLVNAILRASLRQEEEIQHERIQLPLHIRYSVPQWIIERWTAAFGREHTIAMLERNNEPPPFHVRRNPLIPMTEDTRSLIPLEFIPGWYSINGPLPVESIQSGALYVADPSTRHAIDLLDPRPGEFVLDACAAPGGKSVSIISRTQGKVHLTATDLHAHRLPVLLENLKNQGGQYVETAQFDWSQDCPPEWEHYFDGVLLDVPCSNTGVMQRRVDVRWRLTPQEITRLAAMQARILDRASKAVKPGGRLVYSTCSIEQEENRQVVDQFLQKHPEFTLKRDHLALPFQEMSDGAYAALLLRA